MTRAVSSDADNGRLRSPVIDREPARMVIRRTRIRRRRLAGLLVAIGVLVVVVGSQSLSSPSTGRSAIDVLRGEHRDPGSEFRTTLGEAGGAVPAGTSVFDDQIRGVANLDPALLAALRQAGSVAADAGIQLLVDSGWRSPEYQEHLLDEAVAKYGSATEAARWVATPTTSAHVSGNAVDIGPTGAAAWLSQHGAAYGLCRIYGNEPWHFELRPNAAAQGCPAMYADPTHDPRMRR